MPCRREELSIYRSTRGRAIFLETFTSWGSEDIFEYGKFTVMLTVLQTKLNKKKTSVRIQKRVSDLVEALTQALFSHYDDQHFRILNHSHL